VNLSAVEVPLVPPGVVTVALTVPVPAGLVAVIDVAFTTRTFVAWRVPNETVAGRTKLVPVMVTTVPPLVGPDDGATSVTVGAAA